MLGSSPKYGDVESLAYKDELWNSLKAFLISVVAELGDMECDEADAERETPVGGGGPRGFGVVGVAVLLGCEYCCGGKRCCCGGIR